MDIIASTRSKIGAHDVPWFVLLEHAAARRRDVYRVGLAGHRARSRDRRCGRRCSRDRYCASEDCPAGMGRRRRRLRVDAPAAGSCAEHDQADQKRSGCAGQYASAQYTQSQVPSSKSQVKSQVPSRKSQVASRKSQVASRKSQVTSRESQVTSRESQVASRKSRVASRECESRVASPLIPNSKFQILNS